MPYQRGLPGSVEVWWPHSVACNFGFPFGGIGLEWIAAKSEISIKVLGEWRVRWRASSLASVTQESTAASAVEV